MALRDHQPDGREARPFLAEAEIAESQNRIGQPARRCGALPGAGDRRVPHRPDRGRGPGDRDPRHPRRRATDLVTRHWLREHRRPLSILLADDSDANRIITTRILERAGHRVTAVGDGRQAVDEYPTRTFDAVVLDMEMPVKSGPDAAREIRAATTAGAAVPIIALTGRVSDADRIWLLLIGMDAVLAKPLQRDEMLGLLDDLVRGETTPELTNTR